MRWKKFVPPPEGTTREERIFLVFPTTIDGETRWLEMATVQYKWVNIFGDLYEKQHKWVD